MNYHDREREYRAHPGLNQSTLKLYREGAAIGRHKELNPSESTKSQSVGTLVERMVYCPEDPRAVVRQKETSQSGKDANAKAKADGFILVAEDAFGEARELAQLIQRTVDLSGFQHGADLYADGRKCLFDFLDESTDRAYDLKVTEHALDDDWLDKSMAAWGWHMQAGWYCDIYRRVTGRKLDYRLIVASAVVPYRVEVLEPDPDDVALGLAECEALAAYRQRCVDNNHFPHLPLRGKVKLPRWYRPFEGAERKVREVAMDLSALDAMAANIDAGNLPDVGF